MGAGKHCQLWLTTTQAFGYFLHPIMWVTTIAVCSVLSRVALPQTLARICQSIAEIGVLFSNTDVVSLLIEQHLQQQNIIVYLIKIYVWLLLSPSEGRLRSISVCAPNLRYDLTRIYRALVGDALRMPGLYRGLNV